MSLVLPLGGIPASRSSMARWEKVSRHRHRFESDNQFARCRSSAAGQTGSAKLGADPAVHFRFQDIERQGAVFEQFVVKSADVEP